MQIVVDAEFDAPVSAVMPWVETLEAYPEWTGLVHRVVSEQGSTPPAWSVELRARLGPLARSKRLRMRREEATAAGEVRFVRAEVDGRDHGHWELVAHCLDLSAAGRQRTRLTMTLSYDGANWAGGLVERTLQDEIKRSRARITELVSAGRMPGQTH